MPRLVLIEDEKPVGYVDTETLEVEYNGKSELAYSALKRIEKRVSLGMSKDDLYGTEAFLEGERVVEYVNNMAADDMIPFAVVRRDEYDK